MFVVKEFLKRCIDRCGYRVSQVTNTEFFQFESLLYHRMAMVERFEFIQIGAGDGITNDPIHKFVSRNRKHLRGVVIEPLPDVFKKLCKTYQGSSTITPINCAIHNTSKEMSLYRVDPSQLDKVPDFATGIASFDEHHHERTNIPSKLIVAEKVPCFTLRQIVEQYEFKHLDLLQIDAEGYDTEIINGLDLADISPAVIRFEHGIESGTTSEQQLQQTIKHLHENGYELAFLNSDAVAYRRELTLQTPVERAI